MSQAPTAASAPRAGRPRGQHDPQHVALGARAGARGSRRRPRARARARPRCPLADRLGGVDLRTRRAARRGRSMPFVDHLSPALPPARRCRAAARRRPRASTSACTCCRPARRRPADGLSAPVEAASIEPSARRTSGGGWPALAKRRRPFSGSKIPHRQVVITSSGTVAPGGPAATWVTGRVVALERCRPAASWRTCPMTAAASTPCPATSPIAIATRPSPRSVAS